MRLTRLLAPLLVATALAAPATLPAASAAPGAATIDAPASFVPSVVPVPRPADLVVTNATPSRQEYRLMKGSTLLARRFAQVGQSFTLGAGHWADPSTTTLQLVSSSGNVATLVIVG